MKSKDKRPKKTICEIIVLHLLGLDGLQLFVEGLKFNLQPLDTSLSHFQLLAEMLVALLNNGKALNLTPQ